jgi:hypothetical protein
MVSDFDAIVRAVAFKREEVTTDLLCVEVELANGESIVLHEELGGFEAWLGRIEALPGVDPSWRGRVLHPPFARNETVLFESQGRE